MSGQGHGVSGHLSANYQDDDGWTVARCTCGWTFGPVPDDETATDVLMEHAAERAAAEVAS